ncbi:hypothetical protein [Paenibacillus lactis]|uniref:hypothetical protein n=1 Tax=Paenibacillus lactis TaxID=228574 RepID=UPI0011A657D7
METEKKNVLDEVTKSMKQVDGYLILNLLKNPLNSIHLTEKHFIYGILGLASSLVGFLLWTLLMGKRIASLFFAMFGFGGGGLFSELPSSVYGEVFGRMLLLGLLSTVALLAAVWLIGWWRSGKQPVVKLFVTRVGAAHYIGAVGFVLAGILSFSFNISFLLLLITLLSLLALTLHAAMEASGIVKERTAGYLILSVSAYVLLMSILTKLIL